jgi:hypothetical protein
MYVKVNFFCCEQVGDETKIHFFGILIFGDITFSRLTIIKLENSHKFGIEVNFLLWQGLTSSHSINVQVRCKYVMVFQ